MANTSTAKCPECYAPLNWDSLRNTWACPYCQHSWSQEQLEAQGVGTSSDEMGSEGMTGRTLTAEEAEFATAMDGTDASGSDLVEYTCENCRAKVLTSRTTGSTTCAFCQYPLVLTGAFSGDFKPDGIIPFKYEREYAEEQFRKFIKKPLTPKAFLEKTDITKVQPVYVPFWLYTGTAQGVYHAECKKEHPWHGDTRQIDIYDCWRQYALEYKAIPADASERIDDASMDSIEPYDLNEMQTYNAAYLNGRLSLQFDADAESCFRRIEPRIVQSGNDFCEKELKKKFNNKPHKLSGDECTVRNASAHYVLMPAWLLFAEYEGKTYQFAMNGQTGKFIGDCPVDKKKMILHGAVTAIGGFLIPFITLGLVHIL